MHKLTNRVEKLETKNQFKKQWEASKQANKVKRDIEGLWLTKKETKKAKVIGGCHGPLVNMSARVLKVLGLNPSLGVKRKDPFSLFPLDKFEFTIFGKFPLSCTWFGIWNLNQIIEAAVWFIRSALLFSKSWVKVQHSCLKSFKSVFTRSCSSSVQIVSS